MAARTLDHRTANLWTARFIPLLLIGIVGYVTYVIVVLVCVNYLLRPSVIVHKPRPGAAIAILVLYFVLLFAVAVTYFRLLYTVNVNPGYVPQGPQWHAKERNRRIERISEKENTNPGSPNSAEKQTPTAEHSARMDGYPSSRAYMGGLLNPETGPDADPTPGLHNFYNKDVFVCEGDGRPIFCSTCLNWKPDRTHHCSEVGRCVRRMDHFCPWVGGIVSETNFKFFIQFVAWTAILCLFALVFMAKFVAELKKESNRLDVHWILTLSFAALFFIFNLGMSGSSIQFALVNTTTVDNLTRHTKVWTLAVYMPRAPDPTKPYSFRTITYPLAPAPDDTDASQGPTSPGVKRTFAILHTKPGENPWDLGPFGNFKSVMGEHWYDWLTPLRYSPCCNHDRDDSDYPLGPVVERMREEAGIALPRENEDKATVGRRRHRRARRGDGNEGRRSRSERERRRNERSERKSNRERDGGVRGDVGVDPGGGFTA